MYTFNTISCLLRKITTLLLLFGIFVDYMVNTFEGKGPLYDFDECDYWKQNCLHIFGSEKIVAVVFNK